MLEEEKNPVLTQVVERENELKDFVVQYVGEELKPENGEITVEMIIEVFAKDFPEFLMPIAEENFIRGYQQAFLDIEAAEAQLENEESQKDDE